MHHFASESEFDNLLKESFANCLLSDDDFSFLKSASLLHMRRMTSGQELPLGFLITVKDETHGKKIADCLLKHFQKLDANPNCKYSVIPSHTLSAEEIIGRYSGALIVTHYSEETTSNNLCQFFTEHSFPSSVTKVLITTPDQVMDLKANDAFYWDIFRVHHDIASPDSVTIYSAFMDLVSSKGYEYDLSFTENMKMYIDVVYNADPRHIDQEFIDDLWKRVLLLVNSQYVSTRLLTEKCVPYSEKVNELKSYQPSQVDFDDIQSTDEYNIITLAMSTLQKTSVNFYSFKNEDDHKQYLYLGTSQLHPGTMHYLHELSLQGRECKEIIVFNTPETRVERKIEDNLGNIIDTSAYKFYQDGINDFINNKEIALTSDEQTAYTAITNKGYIAASLKKEISQPDFKDISIDKDSGTSALYEFISRIQEIKTKHPHAVINLYIDVQGGRRTFFFTLTAALMLTDDKQVIIRDMIESAYDPKREKSDPHPIRKVTNEYNMLRLVSGIRAFSHYGRAGELASYLKYAGISTGSDQNSAESQLINIMNQIDGAMRINDPNAISIGVQKLKNNAALLDADKYTNTQFKLIVDEIKATYAPLLATTDDDHQQLNIIRWLNDHLYTVNALTFVEDKLPGVLLKCNPADDEPYILKATYDGDTDVSKLLNGMDFYRDENNIFHSIHRYPLADSVNLFLRQVSDCISDWLYEKIDFNTVYKFVRSALLSEETTDTETKLKYSLSSLSNELWKLLEKEFCDLEHHKPVNISAIKREITANYDKYLKENNKPNQKKKASRKDYSFIREFSTPIQTHFRKSSGSLLGKQCSIFLYSFLSFADDAHNKKLAKALFSLITYDIAFQSLESNDKAVPKEHLMQSYLDLIEKTLSPNNTITDTSFHQDGLFFWAKLMTHYLGYENKTALLKAIIASVQIPTQEQIEQRRKDLSAAYTEHTRNPDIDSARDYADKFINFSSFMGCEALVINENNTCSTDDLDRIRHLFIKNPAFYQYLKKTAANTKAFSTINTFDTAGTISDPVFHPNNKDPLWITIEDKITLSSSLSKEKEPLFTLIYRLYLALKKERNNSNHASMDYHNDVDHITKAIDVLVTLCEELLRNPAN